MNYDEYTKRITQEVDALSQKEKVVLCLICCERLVPLYEKFSETEDFGSVAVLCESERIAKGWLQGDYFETSLIAQQLADVIPDMDDFGSISGSFALNAGLAHEHLLEQMQSDDSAPAFYALLSCYDTIDFYVQDLLDPDCKGGVPEVEIENHEMVVNEIKWQLNIFEEIKSSKRIESFSDNYEAHAIIDIA
jgi:uncharacterized protein YjaG (DUF416 family)